MNRLEMIDKPVYNNRLVIGEQRSHTIAFTLRLNRRAARSIFAR
jgi:hypothetical protein